MVVPFILRPRFDEKFHLHLFELAVTENEIACDDFIAERAPDLCDPERNFFPHRVLHVAKIHKNSLRGFGTQESHCGIVLHRTDEGFEHGVKRARLGQRAIATVRACVALEIGRAKAMVTGFAFDERISERIEMAAGFPHSRVHNDRRINADDVLAVLHHRFPPRAFDIIFQLDAERTVIPESADAAVDLTALKNKAAPLAQRYDGFHVRHAPSSSTPSRILRSLDSSPNSA